jgi:uncharacterized SAM-binding protein YcdF (DUF218 family)
MGEQKYSQDHYERLTELALIVYKLWKSGVDISSGAISKSPEHRKLCSAATFKGISWQEVLIASGVPLDEFIKEKREEEWSIDHYDRLTELALEVNKLWKEGVDISSSAISRDKKHQKLYSAALQKQITWQEILVAAGIPTDEINKKIANRCKYPMDHYDRLTELGVIIHELWKSGVKVSKLAMGRNAEYKKYLTATYSFDITWEEVLVAAGIPLEKVIEETTRMSWPLEHYDRLTELGLVVNKLHKNGVDVSSKGILNNLRHKRIYSAASNMGISWEEVLVAAGISFDKIIERSRTCVWSNDHYERLTELALEVHKLWKSDVDVSSTAIVHDGLW